MFLSMIIGLLIVGLSFGTVAGSIALLVRNVATIKAELLEGIAERTARSLEQKTLFEKEE